MSTSTCPSREELFDYVVGRLSDEVSDGVAEHLESCQSCQAGLATFDDADDTLVARLGQPPQQDPYLGESQCQVAVAGAKAVGGRGSLPAPEPEPVASRSELLGTLGEYQLLEKLGRGGMGTVYKAIHTKLDRVVALKVLPKSRSDDDRAIARFEREMKAIGRLDHPNIVGAYDAREIEGKPVLIMQYVEGLDLGKLVRRCGPLTVGDACELARQAALGLQYAHENGLVHRDVKPSNLMLTPQGEVKILDLGLARFHRTAEGDCPDFRAAKMGLSPSDVCPTTPDEMTGTGQAMGTADYMAPEQASDSRTVDIRADVYSLGCTLYKLLSGRAPFGGPDYRGTFEKMTAHVQEPVPPIGESDADVPDELAAVLDRMLAKEPDERFATPEEVAEALKPFCIECDLAGLLVRAVEAEPAAPEGEPPCPAPLDDRSSGSRPAPLPFWRRGKLVAAAIGLMLLSVGGGLALGIIITIYKDGQTVTLDVADGTRLKVDKGGVGVTLPGEAGKPGTRAAAKSDFEAIQGSWQVVRATLPQNTPSLLSAVGRKLRPKDVIGNARLVITGDALKVQGEHVADMTYKYQINLDARPKMIDLQCAEDVILGAYELEGDELKICSSRVIDKPETGTITPRPREVWAEYGSQKELLVLRRVGKAVAETADEKAIQGTWEIVHSEVGGNPGALGVGWYTYDPNVKNRRVIFTRHDMTILSDATGPFTPMRETVRRTGTPYISYRYAIYGYAIGPSREPKTVNFGGRHGIRYLGIYELDGDRLRICMSFGWGAERERPKVIPTKPREGHVVIEMRRARDVSAVPDAEAILGLWEVVSASGAASGIVNWRSDAPPEDMKGTWLKITGDTINSLGKYAHGGSRYYHLDSSADPKTIDLKGGVALMLGVYELTDDQLSICLSEGRTYRPDRIRRPPQMSPEDESCDQLVVLKRVGSPDPIAIQGKWEIVRCEGQLPHQDLVYCFTEELKDHQVSFMTKQLSIGDLPFKKKDAAEPRDRMEGTARWQPKYALDPSQAPKTIDLVLEGSAWLGIYKREGGQLTVCLGKTRPTTFEAKPGEDQALIVMRRVRKPWALPDAEAILGTWEVVSFSQGRVPTYGRLLLYGNAHMGGEGITPAEVWRSSSVVITKDALKVRGKHLANMNYEYQIGCNRTPKAIDLLGETRGARGIYELEAHRLKMCLVWIGADKFGQCRRPDAFSEGLGATNELVVLKRISDAHAMIEADEKAMQGTWEVVKAWAKMAGWADSGRRKCAAPYGEIAEGRKVVIKGSSLTIKGLPAERVKSEPTKADAAGVFAGRPLMIQPMAADDAFEFELYLHGRIDFDTQYDFQCSGLYRLDGDRLTIRLGQWLPPKQIDTPPADREVFLELKRVGAAPASDDQAPAGIHQNDGIRGWPPDEPKPAATGPS